MKHEKWYQVRLSKYFNKNYIKYEDYVEFWNNPSENQWLFQIPEIGLRVQLTCDDKGVITDERCQFEIKCTPVTEELYQKVKNASEGFDAVYEDHIVNLIGEGGLDILKASRKIEGCGFINGRSLYALA